MFEGKKIYIAGSTLFGGDALLTCDSERIAIARDDEVAREIQKRFNAYERLSEIVRGYAPIDIAKAALGLEGETK